MQDRLISPGILSAIFGRSFQQVPAIVVTEIKNARHMAGVSFMESAADGVQHFAVGLHGLQDVLLHSHIFTSEI